MRIPIISDILRHNMQTMERVHQRTVNNNRLKSSPHQTKQTLNSSQDFKKAPNKVPVYVTPEQYKSLFVSPAEKLSR